MRCVVYVCGVLGWDENKEEGSDKCVLESAGGEEEIRRSDDYSPLIATRHSQSHATVIHPAINVCKSSTAHVSSPLQAISLHTLPRTRYCTTIMWASSTSICLAWLCRPRGGIGTLGGRRAVHGLGRERECFAGWMK